ncbi:MAG: ATP-binding protein [Symploca sp. SIO2G7]|nr:ATP-binding protein [Symploca sp. SIO2G7]
MTSIDELILRSTNPFDNYRSVNFWDQQQTTEPTVNSIHKDAIAKIEATLDQVALDHRTRTVRLEGDPGSGKTFLLGRLKRKLNPKAFFAYIPPFPQSDEIWRHILRYTVNSLVEVPHRQQDSQLLRWLKSLSVFKQRRGLGKVLRQDSPWDWLRTDKQRFIANLKKTYQRAPIYNVDSFFSLLHDLTDPKLYPLACEWLKGDDLSEESLEQLGLRHSIESEEAAYEILANFGRISITTQPIVLCFDQLESIACLPDGSLNLSALFNANTKIHDENHNFLIIISIIINTWKQNEHRLDQSHKDRIDSHLTLRPISIEQAQSIWATRLFPLHSQAKYQPNSVIYPLKRQYLETELPSGKTNPRNALLIGRDIFQQYKEWLAQETREKFQPNHRPQKEKNQHSELLAAFKLTWFEELTKIQEKFTSIRQLSSPELIRMLQEALTALQVEDIATPLLTKTKYASYSLGYQLPTQTGKQGVIWTEDSNMNSFFNVMKVCQKEVQNHTDTALQLIRSIGVGKASNAGHQLYQTIFTGSPHRHLIPSLNSVHYLVTYHNLVKDAREGDLLIGSETLELKGLQALIRESNILENCQLLQDLGIFVGQQSKEDIRDLNNQQQSKTSQASQNRELSVKDYLFNLVKTQGLMGRQILVQNICSQFTQVQESQVEQLLEQLCQEKQISILNPKEQPEAQLVYLGLASGSQMGAIEEVKSNK